MRLLLVIVWAFILGVLTCNISLNAIFYHNYVNFLINPNPRYGELFKLDFKLVHSHWIIVKLGHLVGFAILDFLLYYLTSKRGLSALITVLYAIATEILQLYFYRDGRVYDMAIDSMGVIVSIGVVWGFKRLYTLFYKKKSTAFLK